ncbi:MAG: isocitrate lyase/PEP mutase family protein [Alphaproteobacteria bacterium]|nr:isocitrate lyase/PEP mutase family protein [Alphaproteobacteria bacterium]
MAGWKGMPRRFRDMLRSGRTYVQPGVFNAQSAQIAERAGFETIGASGYSISATMIGKPDVGLTTMTEVVQMTGLICDAVSIPVMADADTGYGNAINAMRTVEQLIKAGVGGMFMEDQVAPKRCGHVSGKQIIPLEEAVGKYRAAVRVRDALDPDVVLIARCDARGVAGGSLDEVVRRGRAYMEAGVDVLFPEGLVSRDEIAHVAREVGAPMLYNRTGISPNLSLEELNGLGVFIVANAGGALRAASRALWDYLHAFAAEDAAVEARLKTELKGHPVADFHAFVGFPEIRKLEAEFLPKEELERKYEGSLGFRP